MNYARTTILAGLLTFFALDGAAAPPDLVELDLAARVLAVDGDRVTIGRGARHGVAVGQAPILFTPNRRTAGETSASVDTTVLLGRGEVVEVMPEQAVVRLTVDTGEIRPGDYAEVPKRLPAHLAQHPLVRVAAFDVVMNTLEGVALYSLPALLENDTDAFRRGVYERMLAEIHARAEMARGVYLPPINAGRFHGKHLHEAFAASTVQEVADFVEFVGEFPGKYLNKDWRLVEIYATWLINESPSGRASRLERELEPRLAAARSQAAAARLDEAAAELKAILAIHPEFGAARTLLDDIRQVQLDERKLAADPADTALRWKLARQRYVLKDDAGAARELAVLEKAGFRPYDVRKYQGYVLTRQGRYDEAIRIFEALVAERPDDDNATRWLRSARARQQRQGGADYEAYLQLARIAVDEEAWDSAQSDYRQALLAARTGAEINTVRAEQQRVQRLARFDEVAGDLDTKIDQHEPQLALEKVELLIVLAGELGLGDRLAKVLLDAAERARANWENPLAREILRRRLDLRPQDAEGMRALAWLYHEEGRQDAALAWAGKALTIEPQGDYAHQIASRAHIAEGRLDDAETHARIALRDESYAWPRFSMALIAAGRERWSDAERWIGEVWTRLPDDGDVRLAKAAIERARLASTTDTDRARLTIARTYVQLGLWQSAEAVIGAMSDDGLRDQARWSLAISNSTSIPVTAKLRAARAMAPSSDLRRLRLAELEALAAFEADPRNLEAALAAGRALIARGRAGLALARVKVFETVSQGAADLVELAKRALRAADVVAHTRAAQQRGVGSAAERRARYAEARAMFTQAGNLTDATHAAYQEAWELSLMGQKAEALALLKRLLPEVRRVGRYFDVLAVEQTVADLEMALGTLDARVDQSRAAAARCEAEDDDSCAAHNLLRLARALMDAGQLQEATRVHERALVHAERLGDRALLRWARFEQANLRYVRYELPEAAALAEQLLKDSREASDDGHEQLSLMILGAVAMRRGDPDAAHARFEEVYKLGERIGDSYARAQARKFQGLNALQGQQDAQRAVALLDEARAAYRGVDAELEVLSVETLLGQAKGRLGQVDEARQIFQRTWEAAHRRGRTVLTAELRSELSLLEARAGNAPAALKAARESVELASKMELPSLKWAAYHALGKALDLSGDQAGAVAAYEKAVAEASKRVGRGDEDGSMNFGRTRELYKEAIDLLIRMGRIERALEILETARDANLRRMFDPDKVRTGSEPVDRTLRNLGAAERKSAAARRTLKAQKQKPADEQDPELIDALSERVSESDAEVKRLLMRLKARHRGLYNAFAVDPRSLLNDRDVLPPKAAVVAYFVAGDTLYAFLIARDRPEAKAVKVTLDGEDLGALVGKYRRALQKGSALSEELSRQLYGWLLKPLEADLADMETVLIMPSGPLYFLPFHALITSDEGDEPRYAIERFRMAYLSSTTVQELRRPPRRTRVETLTAFANPDGSLPGAMTEMERVKEAAFPGADVLYGEDAVKDAVFARAGKSHIMHFATHGVLDPDPLRSHLTMASGALTVDDIAGIDFGEVTDLIVLSACQTAIAVGEVMGEGISIAEAFATAGAPTLVASLWDVDDEATARMMASFYRRLAAGEDGDLLDALRAAQLQLLNYEVDGLRPYADPVYWAAFELIGDYR